MPKNKRAAIVTIGGSDSAGLAGIQMDNQCAQAFGVHCISVISTVTAQTNTEVLLSEPVSEICFEQQLKSAEAFTVNAIKIGVLASRQQAVLVSEFIRQLSVPVIWDPVWVSSSGGRLSSQAITEISQELLPWVTLVTPNLSELSALTGLTDPEQAALKLLNLGAKAALVKGGHQQGDECQDYFCSQADRFWISSPRQPTENTRGTGCALSTTVACALALAYSLKDAVVIAKAALNQGLRQSYGLENEQKGSVHMTQFPNQYMDLPWLTLNRISLKGRSAFADCGNSPLGLYPIVDRAFWLKRLLPLGITTIQLRIKDLSGESLLTEIQQAVAVAREYQCRLFINDYWELAIECGAYGVHLGQEDLEDANLQSIHKAGLRLGVSTHCHYEVARACAIRPSYIACGPVYPTTTKQMPWQPQGLDGLTYWRQTLSEYPIVAIGGIDLNRMAGVVSTGVDGIALISAITQAENPEQACRALLEKASWR